MSAVKILPNYTYDDYVHWEGKWEFIEGVPFAMSPAAVPKHQKIAAIISSEFIFKLKKCKNVLFISLLITRREKIPFYNLIC